MTVNQQRDTGSNPAGPPERPIHLLFIHHSTGGQLLADLGPEDGKNCIYKTHPNGGGLRRMLERNNYIVHEASYGSVIGDKTDICHWNAKFRDHMDRILTCKGQDEQFTDGTVNRIVIFKSCFPNSWIDAEEGTEPGDPDSCEHTTANYKAAYNSLLAYFAARPDTLFVAFTAPPLVKPTLSIKQRIKLLLGMMEPVEKVGMRARAFNNWLKDSKAGWLSGYAQKNVVVFDYYDVLTGHGRSDWSIYGSRDGKDSHPSSQGNRLAADEFVPFLNRAVHRMWE